MGESGKVGHYGSTEDLWYSLQRSVAHTVSVSVPINNALDMETAVSLITFPQNKNWEGGGDMGAGFLLIIRIQKSLRRLNGFAVQDSLGDIVTFYPTTKH